jgi:hypothetical protein
MAKKTLSLKKNDEAKKPEPKKVKKVPVGKKPSMGNVFNQIK